MRPPPLLLVLFVLLALASMAHTVWSLLEPNLLADPRIEVKSFVGAVRAGAATEGDRAALAAYRAGLPPRAAEALAHEVNYLLFRDGRPQRFGFDAAGRLIDLLPDTAATPPFESPPASGGRGPATATPKNSPTKRS